MGKISEQELDMGIASFIEKRRYAGLRVELTPQQALDIYTELRLLREVAKAVENVVDLKRATLREAMIDGKTLKEVYEKWEVL